MANERNKKPGLTNVSETWDQNEKARAAGADDALPAANDLDRVIKEEAAEYDQANKEERILGGNRATLNDDEERPGSEE